MHITASILKHLFYRLQHQNYMIYCFTTTGINMTGPNRPEGLGSQLEASKIPFFTFSFFLADMFTL